MSPEARFERELEQFRRNSNAAAQFLYAWISFHSCAKENINIRRSINEHALFWNTTLSAFQTSLFIALGRIFDRDPRNHTLERLLREATQNITIFSRRALTQRKERQSHGAEWIENFVRGAYEPTRKDIARFQRYVASKRAIYERVYRNIRHRVFAHSGITTRAQSDALFSRTNIRELQRLVLSLGELYETLWQLYVNGRRPVIRRSIYTVAALRKLGGKGDGHIPSIQEAIVKDTYEVLAMCDHFE